MLLLLAVEEIEARMMKKNNMEIQVSAVPASDKVLIRNLHDNFVEDVTLYFESKRECPSGGDVVNVKIYDSSRSALVQFQDPSGKC